ncbi:MAG: hypothetical protein ACK2U9_12785, partial [Anaerolineae bacterium]
MKTDEFVPRASGEQLLYARLLAAGMFTGLGLLLVTFALYVTGVVEPAVPIHSLPEYWGLSAEHHLELINAHMASHRDHIKTLFKESETLRCQVDANGHVALDISSEELG